jgi:Ca2+-binding EF-hand superfamily protein
MFRRFLVSVSLAFVCVGAAVVSADRDAAAAQGAARMRFEVMDSNHDGVITREEWRGSARSFTVHDWNGDGRLSGDEVRIGAHRNTNWDQVDPADDCLTWTPAAFQALDRNRDGRISRTEWPYSLETFRRVDRNRDNVLAQPEFLGTDYDDDRGDYFDDLDLNNNGRVERSEWHGGTAAFNDMDANRDGVEWADNMYDQFYNLDVDRSGAVERDEWPWALGSFDRRDLDHNNTLSRREFAVTGGTSTSGTTTAATRQVRVSAKQRWTDTGIDVRAGDIVTFDSSGEIQMSGDTNDKASPRGSLTGRNANEAPFTNQLAGSLIARIGGVGPIFVGNRTSITAPATGRVSLGVNDDYLDDNSGFFTVTVSRQVR